MTIITTVVNPIDDSEVTLATGTVKRILYKEASVAQKKYDTTHNASIIISAEGQDDVFVNLSLKIKDGQEPQIRYAEGKKGSETWHTLNAGDEVKIQMKDVNKVGDKTYYQSSVSRIKVTKRNENSGSANGNQVKGAASQSSYKKRDMSGMETGHALNGALELIRGGTAGEPFDLAKIVHEATVELKAETAKVKGVDVSDYDLGASVGHAILNACRDINATEVSKEDLINAAKEVMAVAEKVSQFVKGEVKEEAKQEKVKSVKKEGKKEPKPEPVYDNDVPPMDFDDDIPFAPICLMYPNHAIYAL